MKMCMRCGRNFLIEYEYEFTCFVCGFNIIKPKSQLSKLQIKKRINFNGRLKYANNKIISISMEIETLMRDDDEKEDLDRLATYLTLIKRKKLYVNETILRKFYEMSDDFEVNPLSRGAIGIQKAGNYALRMMKWLVSQSYYENINYYDLIATVLMYMKGKKLNGKGRGR